MSAYTREDGSNIPSKGSSARASMDPIDVQCKGVHKLLLDLKIHKASGPDSIPAFILEPLCSDQAGFGFKLVRRTIHLLT